MELPDLTYTGPQVDEANLSGLPACYAQMLRQVNGFIAFRGGLHIRGVCDSPHWHSLAVMQCGGKYALHRLFQAVRATDIPFGQDCMGDQFILRDDLVYRLSAESGELVNLSLSFDVFFERVESSPVEMLLLQPLLQFERESGHLLPDQSLGAYPPFVTTESAGGVSLRAVPKIERVAFLADFARQLADVPDDAQIIIKVTG